MVEHWNVRAGLRVSAREHTWHHVVRAGFVRPRNSATAAAISSSTVLHQLAKVCVHCLFLVDALLQQDIMADLGAGYFSIPCAANGHASAPPRLGANDSRTFVLG
jgi:hypothetical protein